MSLRIKKNDNVMVITGKDKGKAGKVISVDPKSELVVVEGVGLVKKHQKPSKKYPQGGIIDKNMPIKVSNIMVICGSCNKITRVAYKNDAKEKARVCKKCGEVLNAS
ncbi:MAG: 50S ribosomal protein L24 [candidate division WS2 bacterium ADurb.Bin280]|uniref:Large ribosomal subunit protein uL24 n=1 Tax=candidate division WS2 bacterium ADurb.Bin280 TaxID=1852829 RepID=A0A1V5SE55_9BACT|nr:MAG: 50S ribosomal protein L24 [candidate division WS2 bacterium ADurb.Bin280]